jgi:hypothetical protein
MLRRSAARAFAAGGRGETAPRDPAAPADRRAAARRFFVELRRTFESGIRARQEAAERAGPLAPRGEGAEDPRCAWQVESPRVLVEGIDFVVAGIGVAWRFLDTLDGHIHALEGRDGRWIEREVLGVHLENGSWRPIRRLAGVTRATFRYTSPREIASEILSGHESPSRGWEPV